MRKKRMSALIVLGILVQSAVGIAYVVGNWWPDGDNIVMDDVLLPAATWSDPAQFQMSEWNQVDTTDNSHPFRINANPQLSFGANDGDNTIGFLGEAALNSEYGLSFSSALAWTICWSSGGRYDECDVVIDVDRPWSLGPDNNEWFQSTVLHELGHVRGLSHYNNFLSMQNSGTSKYLRNEILYMDDKVGVRQHASHVSERDVVMYNKWHDGSLPQWMSMSPTTLREGQTINLNDITVENRGTLSFGNLRFGVYLSTDSNITTSDQLLNTGSWGSFGTFSASTFDWSAVIPTVNDCGTRYIGGIIDDNGAYSERFEGNNDTVFTNGVPYSGSSFVPTPLNIRLREDSYEQNDTRATAASISLPFDARNLSVDVDSENDYYRFTVSSIGTIEVDAGFSHSLGNLDLQLLDADGAVVASSTTTTSNESIQYAATAGTYYVRVYGVGGGSCNKYSLVVDFESCPTATALHGAPESSLVTSTLYGFRDGVMAQSAVGRFYTSLFYAHAREARELLVADPELRARVGELLVEFAPKLQTVNDGGIAELTREELTEVEGVLDRFFVKGSWGLKVAAWWLRVQIRSEAFLSSFGFQIRDTANSP